LIQKDGFLNKLLIRQINRYLKDGTAIPEGFHDLFSAISNAYDHYEQDRSLLERALELSSNELSKTNKKLVEANNQVEAKNHDLISSINYAKMIQEAIFPPETLITKLLPESFIFYKPKEIVSGDFFWVEDLKEEIFIAAVDCTGHGVPGAFMSIVGNNLLNDALREQKITEPGKILDRLNQGVNNTLRQTVDDASVKDGMDIAFCKIDRKKQQLEYAGAYNPLYLIRNGQMIETKADKFPIGLSFGDNPKNYTNHIIPYQDGDMVYIFTDGFADQFGGPLGKKYKYERFKTFLLEIHQQHPILQKQIIEQEFRDWMGDLVQIDDTLIIGIKL